MQEKMKYVLYILAFRSIEGSQGGYTVAQLVEALRCKADGRTMALASTFS
jgi:hypothetical protein